MKSYELVSETIKGNNPGRTPIYGWIAWNLDWAGNPKYKSHTAFEDRYEFDMAHLFGGPGCFNHEKLNELRKSGVEITPEVLLDIPLQPVDRMEDYKSIIDEINFYRKDRERFCYVQSNGIFECLNDAFGIENHLMYLILYPDELKEVYKRQTEWNIKFNNIMAELGVDMIHISDDWGSQNSMMFSRNMFEEFILPCHKKIAENVKKTGKFLSLHSDGNINEALNGVLDIGFDVLHPWQETAGMSYETYLKKYSDKFAILGGLCVQSTLGFGNYEKLENEIRKAFKLLKGKRFLCCTTHFVQNHCSFEELEFAYDLIYKLARS